MALFALAGGVAYATIPDGAGVYTACKLNALGTIRLIDPSLPASSLLSHCTALETAISWNQRGQKGDPGQNGTSPTVAQLAVGNANCPTGGAAITDSAGSTAYVCNGANGTNGVDGQSFAGTFTSQNGAYSISVTNTGITLGSSGGATITLSGADLTELSPGTTSIRAGGPLILRGATVAIN